MANISGSQAFLKMLQLHGVESIFGLCGDTSLTFYDVLRESKIRHILTRDERSAAYAADGYARISKKVGVCEGPSGGGATYILPGLIEANDSSIPVMAFTSDVSVSSRGKFPLTELDQKALFAPLTKYNEVFNNANEIPLIMRKAFKSMTTGKPGASHIGLPFDVQSEIIDDYDVWANSMYGSYPSIRTRADRGDIAKATNLIKGSKNPIIICGGGIVISQAEDELKKLAYNIGATVLTSISGQGSISDDDSLSGGVVGSNGSVPIMREFFADVDLVIFVGCRAGAVTTERGSFPKKGVKILHIDVDYETIDINYKTDVALIGDAKLNLDELNLQLTNINNSRVEDIKRKVNDIKCRKFKEFEELANMDTKPIKPEAVVSDLNQLLDDSSIIVADAGTPCPYFSAYYKNNSTGRHFITNRAHGALGYALSSSIGAQVAKPNSRVVSVMGDGSFGFTMGEVETIAREKLPIIMIVISNGVYGWIKAGQKTKYDKRYFSVDFNKTDNAGVAKALGIDAFSVDDRSKLKNTLKKAIDLNRPVLVDISSQELQDANAPVSTWIA